MNSNRLDKSLKYILPTKTNDLVRFGNKNDSEISDEGQKEIFRQKTIYRVGGIFLFFLGFYIFRNS